VLPPTQALPDLQSPSLRSSPRLRVLVVDDNKDAANSTAKLLGLVGHEVQVAYSGPAALREAVSFRPDAVLLDLGLPEIDGYEVARRLRQEPALAHVRLIALSGYGQDADRQRSQEAGFDAHLVKPAEPQKLAELLAPKSD
jgi:two-component system, chemotaxis family, CheB/CheR fusion protein